MATAENIIGEALAAARSSLVAAGEKIDSKEWLADIDGPFTPVSDLALDQSLRRVDLLRMALVNAANAQQQAEEERDEAKTNFAAMDYLVQQACTAAGADRPELLIRRINELKAERDRAQELARERFASADKIRHLHHLELDLATAIESIKRRLEALEGKQP